MVPNIILGLTFIIHSLIFPKLILCARYYTGMYDNVQTNLILTKYEIEEVHRDFQVS